MLGELLLKLLMPLLEKLSGVLTKKGMNAGHLLYAQWGLVILVFATFVSQFYAVGAVSFTVFALTFMLRRVMMATPESKTSLSVYVTMASVCLFLIGLGYDTAITPVCFLLLTWILWVAAYIAFPTLKTFVSSAEMVLSVIAMALFPVYIPVITIFVGVLYIVATGIAVAQVFLARTKV